MTKLSAILGQIDNGTILLPEFQRGYVWSRDQVRGLMRSLYHGYPVGSLLVWETGADPTSIRGSLIGSAGVRLMLLDGQQRITSLYGIMRGKPPQFFEGDPATLSGLHFDVANEAFEFYAPAKMKDNPQWISVTKLFIEGVEAVIAPLRSEPNLIAYMERLVRLDRIADHDFHLEQITGKDKTVDVVVDIFNKVNSGGTKLSKGDLALAKICAETPQVRERMRSHLAKWEDAGYDFTLDWLLRNATAVATGRALFTALDAVSGAEFEAALTSSARYIGAFLDAAAGRLGLDHHRVLMSRYAIPVISRLLHLNGGRFTDGQECDRALYWYIHSALWGRHTGSTETFLARDYEAVEHGGVDELISTLERWRGGNLRVDGDDFAGHTVGSRFYPLLYLLTRVDRARDFGTGLELKAEMLGHLSKLQVHHIFPKALLYKAGYGRSEVNAVANYCFLTQDTNLFIGKRNPAEYFAAAESKHPGVLASQWIPQDPNLWQIENYSDFLSARRELLAAAANRILDGLRYGRTSAPSRPLGRMGVVTEELDEQDTRAPRIRAMVAELIGMGCVEPAIDSEISDPRNGRVLAIAEAYWPDGLQPGQTAPVLLELDPAETNLPRLEELGYEVFTSIDALIGYAQRRNNEAAGLALEEEMVENPIRESEQPPQTAPDHALEPEFHKAMMSIYKRARSEASYNAKLFLHMLSEHGGLDTARRLLASSAVSDGFTALWERKRLDLTVEAHVLKPEFASLFSPEELEIARDRLEQYGYGEAR